MKYVYLLSILSFFCLSKLSAQHNRPFTMKDYRMTELSSNLINKIIQDSNGYIWVATDYGLNKFDGIKYTQYLHLEEDSTSLLSNNVKTLMIDKNGILWIGTNKGIQCYNSLENSFKTISFPENLSLHVSNIIELHDGQMWVTTAGSGVFSINRDNLTAEPLVEVTRLTGDFIAYVYQDKEKYIWFGINDKGLIQMNPVTKKTKKFTTPNIPSNSIICMLEDDNDRLLMSTSKSVSYFERNSQKFIPLEWDGQPGYGITDMMLSHNGTVFISTTTKGQGVKYIDKISRKVLTYTNPTNSIAINTAKIYTLLEDRDKNLWLGCFMKGLLVIPNKSTQFNFWSIINSQNQLGNLITSICKDHEGYIWGTVDRVGVLKLNNKGEVVKQFTDVDDIISIVEDSKNNLWIGSYSKGLAKLDRNTGECNFLNIPYYGYMKTIREGRDNLLYISTFGAGFIQYNPQTGIHKQYNMRQEDPQKGRLGNDWITSILCDSKGLIWFAHYKGVSCFDPSQNRFIPIKHDSILSNQICLSIMESNDGNIWLGTYNGLFSIDRATQDIKNYTVKDGLSSDVICGLAQDKEGNIWCSTFQGINQIKIKDNKIINYYIGNGLFDKIYNRGVYFQGADGIIYWGGNNGITSFYPENIITPSYEHEILTTNLYVHNQSVNINTLSGGKHIIDSEILSAKEFKFSYEDNTFTFEFSTMDFIDPENIYYEYRLKELSSEWSSTLPGINQVTYNHLNPGKYTLEVKAGKFGAFSQPKQFSIIISPPWYKSTWAYAFYLFLILIFGVLIVNLIRKKRNEQINESKLQFFINISHEIRSPLTLIISPMEKLLKSNFDTETMQTLQNMHRNANRILGLVNQLLDIRKLDKGQMKLRFSKTDMVGFIKELFDVFEYQSVRRNIQFTFQHQDDNLEVWIDRNNFDKILMNILSNAFKYTPDGGEINVSLATGVDNSVWGPLQKYMEISIVDSGIGLEEGKIEKIFDRFYQGQNQETFTTVGSGIGLNLARTLVLLHYGAITAKNREGATGSCFTIRIPLGNQHLRKDEIADQASDSRPLLNQRTFIENVANEKSESYRRRTNYKILIIDDEEEIRDFLSQELGELFKVITAVDGVDGLQVAIDRQPDLIISDVMMPNMDGLNLVKRLKNNNNVSHIPIILLTSKAEYQDRIQGLDRGADAYLSKPFNIEELIVTINNLILNRRLLKGKFSGAQDQEDKIKPIDFKSGDDILMERVVTVINENISNTELNVNMLASQVGLSRSQLHRRMKDMTGISPVDFIKNIRLKQAANLLREKKMDVSLVAYSVGFTNQSYFSTMFKKLYGISPTEYIMKAQDEDDAKK